MVLAYCATSLIAALFGLFGLFFGLVRGWSLAARFGICLLAFAAFLVLLVPAAGGPGVGIALAVLAPSPAGAFG